MFQRIVVATDFSSPAAVATSYAVALARTLGAKLELVHAWMLPPELGYEPAVFRVDAVEALRDEANRRIEDAAERIGARPTLLDGPPDVAVVAHASAVHADLIVTGTHGRTALAHVLLGSVAERIVRTSPVPVLVVPRETIVGEALPFAPAKILVPIDFEAASEVVLANALSLAAAVGARVDTVHAWQIPLYFATQSELANDMEIAEKRSYDELVARATAGRSVEVGMRLRVGESVDVIRDAADELGADLLMMATTGRTGARHFLLGSVTEKTLRTTRLPTIVYRRPA